LLDANYYVKLCDFGISTTSTSSNTNVGTPGIKAPEISEG